MKRRPFLLRSVALTATLGAIIASVIFASPAASKATVTTWFTSDGSASISNANQTWSLDATTGAATHTNNNSEKTNDISIAGFLKVWYDLEGYTPATANGVFNTQCGSPHNSTFAKGWTTRYLYWTDSPTTTSGAYLAISFEAPPGQVGGWYQTGSAAYAISGGVDSSLVNHMHINRFDGGTANAWTDALYGSNQVVGIDWQQSGGVSGYFTGTTLGSFAITSITGFVPAPNAACGAPGSYDVTGHTGGVFQWQNISGGTPVFDEYHG